MSLLFSTVQSQLGLSFCKNVKTMAQETISPYINLLTMYLSLCLNLQDCHGLKQNLTGPLFLIKQTLLKIQTFQTLLTCLIHHNTTWDSDQQDILLICTSNFKPAFTEMTSFYNNKHNNTLTRGCDKFLFSTTFDFAIKKLINVPLLLWVTNPV